MTTLREAAQRALTDEHIDALCDPGRAQRWQNDGRQYDRDTVRLVLAALANEPQAEPVGWRTRYRSEPGMIGHYPWSYTERKPRSENPAYETEPLYAHPAPPVEQPGAVGLSEREACLAEQNAQLRNWAALAFRALNNADCTFRAMEGEDGIEADELDRLLAEVAAAAAHYPTIIGVEYVAAVKAARATIAVTQGAKT